MNGTLVGDTTIQSGALFGGTGTGTLTGNLNILDGGTLAFSLNGPITVSGTVSMATSFGITSLLGLDATTADGTTPFWTAPPPISPLSACKTGATTTATA